MSKPSRLISGVKSLGAALGVSGPAAAAYLKRDDWPFNRKSPWLVSEVPMMLKWAATNLRSANVPTPQAGQTFKDLSPLNQLKAVKMQAETAGIKIRNKVLEGDYVDKAEVEGRHLAVLEMIKRRLLAMPNRLPFDESIKAVVRRHVQEEFDQLSRPA